MTTLNDRYRLERELGSGGMALVWLARDEKLDRLVAVKMLSDALASKRDYRRRFKREARIAAGISHPNLVKVYDYDAGGDRPYLVMDYVRGSTLAERAGGRGGPAIDERRLAKELLGALAAIHDAGVVHRDVKPSNVLLDPDGGAHLTDFGVAKMDDSTTLTESGHAIGTLKYMAPEVLSGAPATPRSDLYSCGVLLQECAAGGGRGSLRPLIARLTASDPARRPGSASDALELLEEGAEGPDSTVLAPTSPVASSPLERVGTGLTEQLRRRSIPVPAAILAAIAALALLGALAFGGGGGQTSDVLSPAKGQNGAPSPATPALPTRTDPCIALADRRKALEDAKHASHGHGKEKGKAKGVKAQAVSGGRTKAPSRRC
jgi:eukaryotic-like serine/threonine-protein kinase